MAATPTISAPRANPASASGSFRHFRLVDRAVELAPFRTELGRNEDFWLFNTARQDRLEEQRQTEAIHLREASDAQMRDRIALRDCQAVVDAPLADEFPLTMQWLHAAVARAGGTLARAMYVRLRPLGTVSRHIDAGRYYVGRDRYHLCVVSPDGSFLASGPEHVTMREGEHWWFDNKQSHLAQNQSASAWRTHLIYDVTMPDGSRRQAA